ncbi:MAG TPA: hypothetical protein PLZ36_01705 [Armatimonadota bacterium]|nr:hypothetical protein [Armatimonadota bacterium]
MKQEWCRHPRARRGAFGFVELIIVVVIILGGVLLYINLTASADKAGQEAEQAAPAAGAPLVAPASVPGKAVRRAVSMECQSNLRQLRMLIENAKGEGEDGGYPPALTDIKDAASLNACPVSKEAYHYDQTTGKVSCACPGHESY